MGHSPRFWAYLVVEEDFRSRCFAGVLSPGLEGSRNRPTQLGSVLPRSSDAGESLRLSSGRSRNSPKSLLIHCHWSRGSDWLLLGSEPPLKMELCTWGWVDGGREESAPWMDNGRGVECAL